MMLCVIYNYILPNITFITGYAPVAYCFGNHMAVIAKQMTSGDESKYKTLVELADAHCHLYAFDGSATADAIAKGVATMISNGVDTKSNLKTLEISDGRHVFPALGIHPDYAENISDDEIEYNIRLIRENKNIVKSIGEIGLDFAHAHGVNSIEKQMALFETFIDLSNELNLPISVHSRNAMPQVLHILNEKGANAVHLHFFEGSADDAIEAARRGYMMSIPPLKSGSRISAIKAVPIGNLMAETDSPTANSTPSDVDKAVNIIADAKGIRYEDAARALTENTKRFFNISTAKFMRNAGP
jgi:TatD DNase family protein